MLQVPPKVEWQVKFADCDAQVASRSLVMTKKSDTPKPLKPATDNRANQLNDNNERYWKARGTAKPATRPAAKSPVIDDRKVK